MNYPKVFIRLLTTFHRNIKTTEKELNDKRLSLDEKNILKGWFLLRKNKIGEVIELIQKINLSQSSLVNSQKNLLLGICYNNLGLLKKAESHLLLVSPGVEEYNVTCLKFIASYNLFICYFNLNDCVAAEKILQKMKGLRSDHYRHELLLLQCQFMYFLLIKAEKEAETLLNKLDLQTHKMSESMRLGHCYDKFNFYLAQARLPECLQCLNEMKQCRSFNLSENYIYLKILLEFLIYDKAIYVYPQQFKLNHHYFYQLKVIQAIQAVDLSSARLYWKKLMTFDPLNYIEDFKVKDEESLLFIALKKYRHHLKSEVNQLPPESIEGRKEKILADLIQSCTHPRSKDIIHQLIWGREIADKDDMIKLKKLVSRVRQIYQLNIKFKNNCYFLITDKVKVA
jgi:tetratricopeptide (TPR) repeat protein